jgi:hypothetical protein
MELRRVRVVLGSQHQYGDSHGVQRVLGLEPCRRRREQHECVQAIVAAGNCRSGIATRRVPNDGNRVRLQMRRGKIVIAARVAQLRTLFRRIARIPDAHWNGTSRRFVNNEKLRHPADALMQALSSPRKRQFPLLSGSVL